MIDADLAAARRHLVDRLTGRGWRSAYLIAGDIRAEHRIEPADLVAIAAEVGVREVAFGPAGKGRDRLAGVWWRLPSGGEPDSVLDLPIAGRGKRHRPDAFDAVVGGGDS